MAESLVSRLKRGWNAFLSRSPTDYYRDTGPGYYYRPDRQRFSRGNERSIMTSVLNRIAMDAAQVDIQHVRLDNHDRYLETINSGFNDCMNLEANIDQTGRAFRQDIYASMLDEGCIAIFPVDTDHDPDNGTYTIETMRTGKIVEWYPRHVKINVYNDRTGRREDLVVPKQSTGIVENPLFAVMNEPNSTMQRLVRKLNLLDAVDEHSSSGKLDIIIQLPYVVKTEARRQQAEKRRKDIEDQLSGSTYGIAYTDGTERITQLNRPAENNLMKQIEYLTSMLYSQLGITTSVMDGTADEKTMLNYNNRTIEPLVSAVVDECKRKFLTKTARTQRQSVMYFQDPFKLVTVDRIAEIGDALTRNEIATSNEIRQIIGWKPSTDPKADELRNKNLNAATEASGTLETASATDGSHESELDKIVEELLSSIESEIDSIVNTNLSSYDEDDSGGEE